MPDLTPVNNASPCGDEPRKIVVCNPDDYIAVQCAVTKEYSDVLVQRNSLVAPGTSYVMDGSLLDPIATLRSLLHLPPSCDAPNA